MDIKEINEKVLMNVSKVIERDADQIKPDAHLVNDYQIESLLALEILAVLENEFNIEIPEEELENFVTVNKIVDVVVRCLNVEIEA